MNTKQLLSIIAASIAVLSTSSAFGQSTWAPTTDTSWGTAGNWSPSGVPDGAGTEVDITEAFNGQHNVDLNGNTYTVGTMNIGNSGAGDTGYYYLNNGTINFNNNGNGAVLNDGYYAAGEQINGVVFNLQDDLTVNDNQITTNGTPWGFEWGYGVGTSVTGTGDLTINDNNPFGSAVHGDGTAVKVYGSVDNVGKLIDSGTGTGEVVFNDSIGSNVTEVDQNSATANTTFGSGFQGSTNLVVQQGIAYLQGNGNSYSTMSKVVIGDTADAAPTGASPAALDLGGVGTWTTGSTQTISGYGSTHYGTVQTVAGTTIAPGSTGHIGKLFFGNQTPGQYDINTNVNLAAGTNLSFILGSSGQNSSFDVVGTLTVPTLQLNLSLADNAGADGLGSLGLGTYDLMNYLTLSGASAGDVTSLFDITAPAGFTYTLTDNVTNEFEGQSRTGAGEIDLTITAATPEPGTWAMLLGGLGMLAFVSKIRRERMNR